MTTFNRDNQRRPTHFSKGPAPRRTSGVHGRRDLGGNVGTPFLDRLEAGLGAADGLGFAVELVLGLVEVDLETQGLRHIPRGVAVNLDAVVVGVAEIAGLGIAYAA